MLKIKNAFTVMILTSLIVFFSGTSAFCSEKTGGYTREQLDYTGQDQTRLPPALSLLYTYRDLQDGSKANTYTLRGIYRLGLTPDWSMLIWLNVPLEHNDVPSADNPDGDWEFGIGDISTRFTFTRKLNDIQAVLFGMELFFPTANEEQFGSDKYAMVLGAGYRHFFHGISGKTEDTFVLPNIRYRFDYAGDDDRPDIKDLELVPQVTVGLPGSLNHFVSFYSGEDLRYSFDIDEWFVPFDILYGLKPTDNTAVTAQYWHALVDDYPLYDWKVELLFKYFF